MKRWLAIFAIFAVATVAVLILVQFDRLQKDLAGFEGLTLGEAVERAGLTPQQCTIFDEPPGVARGVVATTGDGTTMQFWISLQDRVFREERDWKFDDIRNKRVVDVEQHH